uniref:Uncharacterized protein n=1 Tax=Anguilla anguilla TaxID=7936 RepID=A0A0E9VG22_ANGAN
MVDGFNIGQKNWPHLFLGSEVITNFTIKTKSDCGGG